MRWRIRKAEDARRRGEEARRRREEEEEAAKKVKEEIIEKTEIETDEESLLTESVETKVKIDETM